MNTKTKRLLKGLKGILIGISAIGITGAGVAMATGSGYSLSEVDAGAAQYLDALDRGSGADGTAQVAESDSTSDDESDTEESNIVMADVKNSLNVRAEADENSDKVGLLYADCGGTILETDGNWTKIKSGNLVGWCNNDYLLFGEEAEALASSVGITIATVDTDALRVRKEPSEDAGIWGLVAKGDSIEAIVDDSTDEWVAIDFEGEEGYISAEYVNIEFQVDSGETLEEIKERERKEREEKAKRYTNAGAVPVGASDEALLAALVYCESGNQSYEGMLAVAAVVMNRVRSGAYPNTVAGVIYASGQFAPALNGKVEAQLKIGVPAACTKAAQEAIAGKTNIGTATHFRRYTGQNGIVIGAHVFY